MADPSTVAGLYAWWKADAIGGTNGATVQTWADSSGNSRSVSQSVAGARPVYTTGVINGLPVLRFGGGAYYDTSTASASLTTLTVFSVVQPTSAAADRSIVGPSTNSAFYHYVHSAGKQQVDLQALVVVATGTATISTSAFSVLTAAYRDSSTGSPGAASLYLNGTADGTGAPTTAIVAGRTVMIGARGGGSVYTGDIAEVILYNVVLSAGDRAIVHSYLSDKYAIPVSDYVVSAASLQKPRNLVPVNRASLW